MRVRFVGIMLEKGYSGGRLLALSLAQSLAMTGAEVDFVVDKMPEMYEEFRSFSKVRMLCADLTNLSPWVDRGIDIVIVVPSLGGIGMHGEWARHAIECRSKIALLNFESPNWFNEVSPYKRSAALWRGWEVVSEHSDLILSISREGDRYARDYYANVPPSCHFDFCYPPINSILADRASPTVPRKRQIVLLTRIDPHKGYNSLDPLAHRDLTGYKVVVYIGTGTMPQQEVDNWQREFLENGIDFSVQPAITGVSKFAMLKSSALLYFPTRFEGFGIPPLEAAYCQLPCACSDLPVLREYGQDAFVYGDPDDPADMHRAIMEALETPGRVAAQHARLSKIARLERGGRRLAHLLERVA